MLAPRRKVVDIVLGLATVLLLLAHLHRRSVLREDRRVIYTPQLSASGEARYSWGERPVNFPVDTYEPLPRTGRRRLPKVQFHFPRESKAAASVREERQAEVKRVFLRCWAAYREHAWLGDEVGPLSGSNKSTFGGWAATLVDSLDALWIMDLKAEFAEAVDAVATIDFTNSTSESISVFETTIRYLGGMLAAYDLSDDDRLLHKAIELAHTLYAAFDTPNRMPINWWKLQRATLDVPQANEPSVLIAEIGSLCLEFTRLSQITRDPMWYDAVHRIMRTFEEQQNATAIPGLWPFSVSPAQTDFTSGTAFSIGAMADSLYEYFPKMYALLGGSDTYERMYRYSMDSAIGSLLYRPMLPDEADVLMAGKAHASDSSSLIDIEPAGEHLACFAGGMFGLGGRLLRNDGHVEIGRRLTEGCIWAYNNSQLGIMPEGFTMLACETDDCSWDESLWMKAVLEYHGQQNTRAPANVIADLRIPRGFLAIKDRRYLLRPEAIESVFLLYRITGDRSLQDAAWRMFQSVENHTRTDIANAAITDVTDPTGPKQDSMESFWLAETLKYFFLVFSPPDLISLDEYVLNTEAHPFKRPRPSWWG